MTPDAEQLPHAMHEALRAARFLNWHAPITTGRINPATRNAFLRGLDLEEVGRYGPNLEGTLMIYGVPVQPDPTVDPGVLVVESEPYVTRSEVRLPDHIAQRVTVENVHTLRMTVRL